VLSPGLAVCSLLMLQGVHSDALRPPHVICWCRAKQKRRTSMKSLLSRELCTFITESCSAPAPDPAQCSDLMFDK